ncbi:MAG: hypothetical protein JNJ60_12680, partial [Rhodocyclaceae bacterium]|nr:hypothetical protein [Rhodocyclaceae bacterium]
LQNGNGGQIVVWSDQVTRYYGTASARGGQSGGDGGRVEISGHQLDFQGTVSTAAPLGRAGTLLLDPANIYLINGADGSGGADTALSNLVQTVAFADSLPGNGEISDGRLNSIGGNVVLQATSLIQVGTSAGVAQNVDINGPTSLTLESRGAGGNVTFLAGSSLNMNNASLLIRAGVNSTGTVTAGDTGIASLGTISASNSVSVDAKSIALAGNVAATNSTVTLTARTGAITGTAGGGADVTATSLIAGAAGGINAGASALETVVATLNFSNSTSGTVSISNTRNQGLTVSGSQLATGAVSVTETSGNLTVGSVNSVNGIITAGAPVTLSAASNNSQIILSQRVDSTNNGAASGGAITLTADQMTLGAASDRKLRAGNQLVTLTTFDNAQNIAIGGSAADSNSQLGLSEAELGTVRTTGGLTIGGTGHTGTLAVARSLNLTSGGNLTGGTLTLINGGAANISFDEPLTSPVAVSVQSNANIVFNSGGSITASAASHDSVQLTAGGAITGNAGTGPDVTTGTLTLSAATGLGTAGTALETAVTALDFTNSGNGAINLFNTSPGGLSVSGSQSGTGAVRVRESAHDLSAGGVSAGANTLTLQADVGAILGNAAAGTDASGTTVILSAAAGIGTAGTALETVAAALNFTNRAGVPANTSGVVNIANSRAAGLSVSGEQAGGAAVTVSESVGDLSVGTVNSVAGITTAGAAVSLSAAASDQQITLSQAIDTTNGGAAAGGAITLTADNLALGTTAQQNLKSGDKLVTLSTADDAQNIVLGGAAADNNTQLGLSADELGTVVGTGGLTIGAAGHTGTLAVSGALDSSAAGNLTGGTLSLTNGGSADVTFTAALTAPVAVRVQSGGNIAFDAGGSISAASNTVTLVAASGAISGNAGAGPDVTAATLVTSTASGVGVTQRLETAVSSLNFTNSGNSAVNIDNTLAGELTLSGRQSGSGAVSVTHTSGDLTVGTVNNASGTAIAGIVTVGGPVTLSALTADAQIKLDQAIASGGGTISLSADKMNLLGAGAALPHLSGGSGLVTLSTTSAGQDIALGGNAADSNTQLGLSAAELATVSGTGGLTIGDSAHTGSFSVSGAVG